MFRWADLATPDVAGSKKFYTELLEVDSTDVVAGPDAFYTILNKNGRSTCAIYQMDEEMQQMMRGQAAWHSYFTVESADDAFSVSQPKSEIGAQIFGEPGALAWNELYTHDTDDAESSTPASLAGPPTRLPLRTAETTSSTSSAASRPRG